MRFLETPIFSAIIDEVLSHGGYLALQMTLVSRPEAGVVIPKSGGLCKIRWGIDGQGNKGGCRIIYHWDRASETFYLLYAYRKNEAEDMTPRQLRLWSQIVRDELG